MKCIRCEGQLTADDPGSDYRGYAHCAACYIEVQKPVERAGVTPRVEPPRLPLTTSPVLDGFRITETREIISAECVLGLNVFRDVLAGLTDVFGGRSGVTQKALRDARKTCLRELEEEARSVGANAVIAVDLDYSEFSGQGKSMILLVASGTAVVVEPMGQTRMRKSAEEMKDG